MSYRLWRNNAMQYRYTRLPAVLVYMCTITSLATGSGTDTIDIGRSSGDNVIVVTAPRINQPAAVTRISADSSRLDGARTVAQALELAPGVTMTTGQKNEAGVMVRGIRAERTLVLIDDRPVSIPYYGTLDLTTVPLDNVDRVTVTRGVPSLLYGVNGSAGVINIATSRPRQPGSYALIANAEAGDVGESRFSVTGDGCLNNVDARSTISMQRSDGYRLSSAFDGSLLGIEDGGVRDNSDFKRLNVTGGLGWNFSGDNSASVSAGHTREEKGIPSSTTLPQYRRFTDWSRSFADAGGRFVCRGNAVVKAKMYYDRFYNRMSEYADAGMTVSSWDSRHDHRDGGGTVHAHLPIGRHSLAAALNGRYETARIDGYENRPLQEHSLTLGSAAVEGALAVGGALPVRLVAAAAGSALRSGDGAATEDRRDWSADCMAGGVLDLEKVECRLAAGMYTRYPTLHQMYGGDVASAGLERERSFNIDAGGCYRMFEWFDVRAGIFNEEFRNLIDVQWIPEGRTYRNIGRASSRGLEGGCSIRWKLARCVLDGDYTLNDTHDLNSIDRQLAFIPMHRLTGRIGWFPFAGARATLRGEWAGKRAGENGVAFYNGYGVLHAALSYTWRTIRLSLFINNFLDADYATETPSYPMPGRMVRAEVSVAIENKSGIGH